MRPEVALVPRRGVPTSVLDRMKVDRKPSGNITEYIAGFPRSVQAALRRVRSTIRKAVPEAEETISYQIPAYKLHGRVLIYFAAWTTHYSIYPATGPLMKAFEDELAPYDMSGRGTIRFPLSEPVPVRLIAALAKFRAKEVAERERARKAARKKR